MTIKKAIEINKNTKFITYLKPLAEVLIGVRSCVTPAILGT